eukprot:4176670-Pleurochrysis_carterae.AAC.1
MATASSTPSDASTVAAFLQNAATATTAAHFESHQLGDTLLLRGMVLSFTAQGVLSFAAQGALSFTAQDVLSFTAQDVLPFTAQDVPLDPALYLVLARRLALYAIVPQRGEKQVGGYR